MDSNEAKSLNFDYGDKTLHAEDSNGNVFKSVNEIWQKELDNEVIEFENNNPELKKNLKGERIGGKD